MINKKDIFSRATGLKVKSISLLGGMTNTNFLVTTIDDKKFVLRISGNNSNKLVDREKEFYIQNIMRKHGFGVEIIYFDKISGIKITKFLSNATNLTPKNISNFIPQIALHLKALHSLNLNLEYKFDPFLEMQKYLTASKMPIDCITNFKDGLNLFWHLRKKICEINQKYYNQDMIFVPTHGDLVPENILVSEQDHIILIDWEYAGANDPCWDLASVIVEGNLSKKEEHKFLNSYNPSQAEYEKIEIYKSIMDILWSAWAIAKTNSKKSYLDYGQQRLNNALKRQYF
ncbi:choline kinase family protein [Campylobacter sp. 9BO]|uniref:phosphotransferase n=1 Tax=Campylobacter sp. 9BO TaxID=3424759 RepID=UPI003D334F60